MRPQVPSVLDWLSSVPAVLVGLVTGLSLCAPALASDYIGLWRVDRTGEGVMLGFPDNGFDGACIRFTAGPEETGEVKVESQIVRHRLDALRFRVTGKLDPDKVHVQVSVKGKTVWIGAGLSLDEQVELPLDGWEATFHIARLETEVEPFDVSFCDLEFLAPEWTVRFTSDCAGLDLDVRDDRLSLIADEDWAALGRDMNGGIGIFGLSPGWLAGQGDVYLSSSFPHGMFDVAVASGGKPILEAQEGLSQPVPFDPEGPDTLELVVKVKEPAPGQPAWRASLDWGEPPGTAEALDDASAEADMGDLIGADVACQPADALGAEGQAPDGTGCPKPKSSSGGCSAAATGAVPWGLLWPVLVVGWWMRRRGPILTLPCASRASGTSEGSPRRTPPPSGARAAHREPPGAGTPAEGRRPSCRGRSPGSPGTSGRP